MKFYFFLAPDVLSTGMSSVPPLEILQGMAKVERAGAKTQAPCLSEEPRSTSCSAFSSSVAVFLCVLFGDVSWFNTDELLNVDMVAVVRRLLSVIVSSFD